MGGRFPFRRALLALLLGSLAGSLTVPLCARYEVALGRREAIATATSLHHGFTTVFTECIRRCAWTSNELGFARSTWPSRQVSA